MPAKGYLTPSTFGDLMANSRKGDDFGRTALSVVEQLTMDLLGVERQEWDTAPRSCQWGIDHEWEAIQTYQDRTMREVTAPVAFTVSPSLPYVGGTMDGLVGTVGGVEIKSPYTSQNHLANLLTNKQLQEQYFYQVHGYLWIFGLAWIDFVSYDPRFPPPYDLGVERVVRDASIIDALEQRCKRAHEMAQHLADKLLRKQVI